MKITGGRTTATLLLSFFYLTTSRISAESQTNLESTTVSGINNKNVILEEVIIAKNSNGTKVSVSAIAEDPVKVSDQILSLLSTRDSVETRTNQKRSVDQFADESQTLVINVDDVRSLENLEDVLSVVEYEPQKINAKKTKRKIEKAYNDFDDESSEKIYQEPVQKGRKNRLNHQEVPLDVSSEYHLKSGAINSGTNEASVLRANPSVIKQKDDTSKSSQVILPESHRTKSERLIKPFKDRTQLSSVISPASSSSVQLIHPRKAQLNDVAKVKIATTTLPYSRLRGDARKTKYSTESVVTTPVTEDSYATKPGKKKKRRRVVVETSTLDDVSPENIQATENKDSRYDVVPRVTKNPSNPQDPTKSQTYGLLSKYDVIPRPFSVTKLHSSDLNNKNEPEKSHATSSNDHTSSKNTLNRKNYIASSNSHILPYTKIIPTTASSLIVPNIHGIKNNERNVNKDIFPDVKKSNNIESQGNLKTKKHILPYIENLRLSNSEDRKPSEEILKVSENEKPIPVLKESLKDTISDSSRTNLESKSRNVPHSHGRSLVPGKRMIQEENRKEFGRKPEVESTNYERTRESESKTNQRGAYKIHETPDEGYQDKNKGGNEEKHNPNHEDDSDNKNSKHNKIEHNDSHRYSKSDDESHENYNDQDDSVENQDSAEESSNPGDHGDHNNNKYDKYNSKDYHVQNQKELSQYEPKSDYNIESYNNKDNYNDNKYVEYNNENDYKENYKGENDGVQKYDREDERESSHNKGDQEDSENVHEETIDAESVHKENVDDKSSGGTGGGDKKFENGEGAERNEGHHKAEGQKGNKGYKSWHEHDKGSKGHHDKEQSSNYYNEKDGEEKEHKEDGGYHEEYSKGEAGKKAAEFGEKGEHQKGHSTKGQHFIHKKDEFEKKTEFFDEYHEDGDIEKDGEYYQEHEATEGGKEKTSHHEVKDHTEKYGKEEEQKKGRHYHENKGHEIHEGQDNHYDHKLANGKKGEQEDQKKWAFKKPDAKIIASSESVASATDKGDKEPDRKTHH